MPLCSTNSQNSNQGYNPNISNGCYGPDVSVDVIQIQEKPAFLQRQKSLLPNWNLWNS